MAIGSFSDRDTAEFFRIGRTRKAHGWSQLKRIVRRKLDLLDYAEVLEDLRAPPGNRLEALKGRFEGFYSIRINDQWRILFKWSPTGPIEVRIVDYH